MQILPARSISRPIYYDRQPAPISAQYHASAAPHANTLRSTYTVPAGSGAFIEWAFAAILRVTAGAAAGFLTIFLNYKPNGLPEATVGIVYMVDNTVGAFRTIVSPNFGYLGPGDQIKLYTADTSTGGTAEYMIAVKGIEFPVE